MRRFSEDILRFGTSPEGGWLGRSWCLPWTELQHSASAFLTELQNRVTDYTAFGGAGK